MGLPVNHFTFWSYLEWKDGEPWHSELKKIKNTFSLFGYIIHHPESNDGFGKILGERFGQLSRMTGMDFLFTAFDNPQEYFDNRKDVNPGLYYLAEQVISNALNWFQWVRSTPKSLFIYKIRVCFGSSGGWP